MMDMKTFMNELGLEDEEKEVVKKYKDDLLNWLKAVDLTKIDGGDFNLNELFETMISKGVEDIVEVSKNESDKFSNREYNSTNVMLILAKLLVEVTNAILDNVQDKRDAKLLISYMIKVVALSTAAVLDRFTQQTAQALGVSENLFVRLKKLESKGKTPVE